MKIAKALRSTTLYLLGKIGLPEKTVGRWLMRDVTDGYLEASRKLENWNPGYIPRPLRDKIRIVQTVQDAGRSVEIQLPAEPYCQARPPRALHDLPLRACTLLKLSQSSSRYHLLLHAF
jgi:hypothetical protein